MQNYVGVPNSDATRFPGFFSADARLMRDFKVSTKYTVRLSVTGYNLTNHFNALAIHNNMADPQLRHLLWQLSPPLPFRLRFSFLILARSVRVTCPDKIGTASLRARLGNGSETVRCWLGGFHRHWPPACYKPRMLFTAILLICLMPGFEIIAQTPPSADTLEHRESRHGSTVVDNYFWLREKTNPKVIQYLKRRIAYTEAMTSRI